jgi:hypothetical protein
VSKFINPRRGSECVANWPWMQCIQSAMCNQLNRDATIIYLPSRHPVGCD